MNNDFLSNAAEKAQEVFSVAVRKTEEIVSANKLKYTLSVTKNIREKDFALLGRLYYKSEKGMEFDENEAEDLIASIEEKTLKIKELRLAINEIKNKKVCLSCGAFVANDSIYCKKCGEKL